MKIRNFYDEYFGHKINQLHEVLKHFRESKPSADSSILFLVGDSTLDNKHWFSDTAPAVNGYEAILDPPVSVKDVAYWLNVEAVQRGVGDKITAINCAVEETTIGRRSGCFGFVRLTAQDRFVRENLGPNDIVILSMGGNDIALRPSICTIASLAALLCFTPRCFRGTECGVAIPCDEGFGCAGCVSNLLAWPPGYGHLLHLFGTRLGSIAAHIVNGRQRPRRVLICMVYYPDASGAGAASWADTALSALGYDRDPGRLQGIMRSLFRQAVSQVRIKGMEVDAVALYEALDGTRTADYAQRVEPSAAGGARLATLLMDAALGPIPTSASNTNPPAQLSMS